MGNNLTKRTGLTEKGQIVPGLYDYNDPRDGDWEYAKNTRFSSRHSVGEEASGLSGSGFLSAINASAAAREGSR